MEHYISLFVKAIFIENMALVFLGMCFPCGVEECKNRFWTGYRCNGSSRDLS